MRVCVCVCVHVRACVHACARACVCVCACVCCQKLVQGAYYQRSVNMSYRMDAWLSSRLKFSRIGCFWIFAVARIPHPLLASEGDLPLGSRD